MSSAPESVDICVLEAGALRFVARAVLRDPRFVSDYLQPGSAEVSRSLVVGNYVRGALPRGTPAGTATFQSDAKSGAEWASFCAYLHSGLDGKSAPKAALLMPSVEGQVSGGSFFILPPSAREASELTIIRGDGTRAQPPPIAQQPPPAKRSRAASASAAETATQVRSDVKSESASAALSTVALSTAGPSTAVPPSATETAPSLHSAAVFLRDPAEDVAASVSSAPTTSSAEVNSSFVTRAVAAGLASLASRKLETFITTKSTGREWVPSSLILMALNSTVDKEALVASTAARIVSGPCSRSWAPRDLAPHPALTHAAHSPHHAHHFFR